MCFATRFCSGFHISVISNLSFKKGSPNGRTCIGLAVEVKTDAKHETFHDRVYVCSFIFDEMLVTLKILPIALQYYFPLLTSSRI